MASSGTFYATVETGFRLQMEWELDHQSVTSNRSTITARLYWMSLSSGYVVYSSASKTAGIQYNNGSWDRKTASNMASLNGNQKKLIHSKTFYVYHDSDGTANFDLDGYFDANVSLNSTYYGTIALTKKSYTLPTIPRTSKPTLNDYYVWLRDESVTIYTNRASSSFTHTLTYKIGDSTGTIATNVTTSHVWTPSIILVNEITDGTNATCTIYCKTYNGNSLIGTETKTLKLYVPEDILPTLTITKTGVDLFNGYYVQDRSKVSITLSAASLYGATITNRFTKINGATYTTNSFTTDVLTSSGTNTIETTVTDTRGRKKTVTSTFTVESYHNPQVVSLTAVRCDPTGDENPQGAYMQLVGTVNYASIQSTNVLLTTLEYRAVGMTDWTNATVDNNSSNPTLRVIVPADVNLAYEVRLVAKDAYSSSEKVVNLNTAFVLMDYNASGKGISFGEVSTTDKLTVNMPSVFKQPIKTTYVDAIDSSLHLAVGFTTKFRVGHTDNQSLQDLKVIGNFEVTGDVNVGGNYNGDWHNVEGRFVHNSGYMYVKPYNSSSSHSGTYQRGELYFSGASDTNRFVFISRTMGGSSASTTIQAGNFATSSSIKFKENIQDYAEDALAKIVGTRIRTYNLKSAPLGERKLGVVIEEGAPSEIVDATGEAIDGYAMTTMAWKAIQQLASENLALRMSVEELTNRIQVLENI